MYGVKILQVSPYIDPEFGGQEKHVLALSQILSSMGHEVTILSCQSSGLRFARGLDALRIRSIRLLGLRIVSITELTKFIRRTRFDVCHLHHQTIFGEIALLANKICKLPTVTTLHSQMLRRLPTRFLYDRTSLRFISSLSSKVICLSPGIMQNLVRRGLDRNECVVVPNAIDVRLLKEQLRRQDKNLSGTEFDLLFVGRLEQRKGVHLLLESIALLHERGKKYNLRVVGRGPLIRELSNTISTKGLGRYVKLLGYVPQNELLNYYLLARIVVIPSLYEGIPTVALEAMAAGKPLIASDIPGLNELVINGANGLKVSPMDIQGLACAIDDLLTRKDSLSSVDSVDELILARHDWPTVANEILNIYREVLRDSSA